MQHPTLMNDVQNQDDAAIYADIVPPAFTKPANFRRKSTLLSVAVSAVVMPGLFATVALPAYAAEPATAQNHQQSVARAHPVQQVAEAVQKDTAQTYTAPMPAASTASAAASTDAAPISTAPTLAAATTSASATAIPAVDVQRDAFSATSVATLKHRHALKVASLAKSTVASGASIGSLLANPPQPHFSLAAVVKTAEKYKGVPYVFGGESPSGFDCSGLVAYVYAQFGVSLPHSAAAQGAMGKHISVADARPGDVVVLSGGSHVGIYLGGGRMIDAPEPGRVVSDDAIYTSDYYIVRFGI